MLIGEAGHDPRDPDPRTEPQVRREFITAVGKWSGKIGLSGGFLWSYGRPPAESFNMAPGDAESLALLKGWSKAL